MVAVLERIRNENSSGHGPITADPRVLIDDAQPWQPMEGNLQQVDASVTEARRALIVALGFQVGDAVSDSNCGHGALTPLEVQPGPWPGCESVEPHLAVILSRGTEEVEFLHQKLGTDSVSWIMRPVAIENWD